MQLGAATSDRIDCGTAAPFQSRNTMTLLAWIYLNTLTANRALWNKTDNGGNVNRWQIDGTNTDELRFFKIVSGTPASCNVVTSDANLAVGKFWGVAVSYDLNAIPQGKIFRRSLATLLTECSYTTQQNSGTLTPPADTTTNPWRWGNTSALNVALQARICALGASTHVLSLKEMRAWFEEPWQPVRGGLGPWFPGIGTGQVIDWSGYGSHGTPTGGVLRRGPALPLPRRRFFPGFAPTPNDTTLAAAVMVSMSAAGALSTDIRLAGGATVAASAAAVLGTDIQLAGASSVAIASAGALATDIRLAGAGTVTLGAVASLATDIRLAGASLVSIAAAGALQSDIRLAAAASITVSATGMLLALTAFRRPARVSLASTGAHVGGVGQLVAHVGTVERGATVELA